MNILLPFSKAVVNCTPCTNGITSILATDMDRFQNVIWENYIKIVYGVAPYSAPVGGFADVYNWENYNCLTVTSQPREFGNLDEVKEKLVNELSLNHYVYTGYDRYYLPICENHINHDLMIYGVNTEQNVFICADFIEQKYTSFEMDIESVCTAILNYSHDYPREIAMDDVHIISIKEDYSNPPLNISKILKSLQETVSTNALGDSTNPRYGFSFFDHLIELVEGPPVLFDLTVAFHLICEHIKLMLYRVRFLQTKNIIIPQDVLQELTELFRSSVGMRNYYMKLCILQKKQENAKKMGAAIRLLKDRYKVVLLQIIDVLKQK